MVDEFRSINEFGSHPSARPPTDWVSEHSLLLIEPSANGIDVHGRGPAPTIRTTWRPATARMLQGRAVRTRRYTSRRRQVASAAGGSYGAMYGVAVTFDPVPAT